MVHVDVKSFARSRSPPAGAGGY